MNNEEVITRLTRIEAKIDMIGDHETRVRALEKEQWLHRGGIGVVALLVTKLGLPWFHG